MNCPQGDCSSGVVRQRDRPWLGDDRSRCEDHLCPNASGVRGILIYYSDYKCSHSIALSRGAWPHDVRLSDIEPRFGCKVRQARRRTFVDSASFRVDID